jgi:thioredoxin 1
MVAEVTSMEALRKGSVLVDFYTTTCGPCRAMNPILEEISNEFSGVKVAKVEVTQNPEVSQMFGIMSVPTFVFMQDCQVKQIIHGTSTKKSLELMVKNHIGA